MGAMQSLIDAAAPLLRDPIFVLAAMLLAGTLAGRLLKLIGLPAMTGYILTGIALGPQTADLIGGTMLRPLSDFTDVALGVIAFNIGSSFDRATLKALGFGVILVTLGELVVVVALIASIALLLGLSLDYALLLGLLGFPAGPTMTYLLLRDLGTQGPFVAYVFGTIALGDVLCVIGFGVLSTLALSKLGGGAPDMQVAIVASLAHEGISLGVGLGLGLIAIPVLHLARRDSRLGRDQLQALFFGTLLATIGVASAFGLSHLLTPLGTGLVLANGMNVRGLERLKATIDPLTAPLFIIFLITAGAHLEPSAVAQPMIALLAVVYVAAGIAGRAAGSFAVASLLRLDHAVRRYLGFSSSIQGGLNVGLALSLLNSALRTASGAAVAPVRQLVGTLLVGVLIYQLIGPLIVRYGVTRGGELAAQRRSSQSPAAPARFSPAVRRKP
jgi:Kef-type K+ transport system membrane component KefB